MRVACLHVSEFALAVCYRVEPDLRGSVVVVTQGDGPRAPVLACSPEAEARGARPGSSRAQARAVDESILFRCVSADAARAARAALCDVAYAHSPRIEEAEEGLVYLEVGGLDALYESETRLVKSLLRRAADVGFAASVGVASTKIAARLAACSGSGRAIVPPREEWSFLAPLPVRMLAPDAALREMLTRWGVRTLGDLAALPAAAVASRLGPRGALLVRRARGEDETPFVSRVAPLDFEEVVEVDYGIEAIDPFLFVVRPLLERLMARLALRGLACGDLRISLYLANRGRDDRTVSVAAPNREIKPLLTLLRLHLESHPPVAPVEKITVAAVAVVVRPTQLDLLRPNGPAPAQMAVTLAKLNALCGAADRVGIPVVADSHRPDAYGVGTFEISGPETQMSFAAQDPLASDSCCALRAVRPPRELEVFEDRGRLDFVRPVSPPLRQSGGGGASRVDFRCQGRVVMSAGPWRIEEGWWRDRPCRRDYYDVQLSDGGVYRLFFDAAGSKWYVDGYYD